jgi:hypothetical protein
MLDHAIGPNIIRGLTTAMSEFLERHADKGWTTLDDFGGLRRGRIVSQAEIARPDSAGHRDGREEAEGYAAPEGAEPVTVVGRSGAPSPAPNARPDSASGPSGAMEAERS